MGADYSVISFEEIRSWRSPASFESHSGSEPERAVELNRCAVEEMTPPWGVGLSVRRPASWVLGSEIGADYSLVSSVARVSRFFT